MKKTSTIKSVQADGTWNGKDGTLFYKYDYVMDDGQALQANHKAVTKFVVGDTVEYEVKRTHETYGASGTVSKPGEFKQGKDPKVQLYIIRQSSLTRAIEHLSYKDQDQMTKENIVSLADYYTKYVLNGKND